MRAEAASRRMVGPRRTRPVGEAAIRSFSAASAATIRCTVERASPDPLAIWPRLRPVVVSFQRAHDRGRARDHLDLALVLNSCPGHRARRSAAPFRFSPLGSGGRPQLAAASW